VCCRDRGSRRSNSSRDSSKEREERDKDRGEVEEVEERGRSGKRIGRTEKRWELDQEQQQGEEEEVKGQEGEGEQQQGEVAEVEERGDTQRDSGRGGDVCPAPAEGCLRRRRQDIRRQKRIPLIIVRMRCGRAGGISRRRSVWNVERDRCYSYWWAGLDGAGPHVS
jgi:hypothetical protein